MSERIIEADCVEAMREMDEASVDAVVCDPPYGLEFMGKEWDRLDHGLPQENVWKGRRGKGGSNIGTDDSQPASRHHVALGVGKRHQFKRCQKCGKRQFSGTPCECADPDWRIETPPGTPSSSIRAQRWHQAWAIEALRVLKPGGHLLAFGGTRTYHRLACAIEDAGFEIRDSLIWLYGSGFPKSLDVSKAMDKAAGREGELGGPKSEAHAGWIKRGAMRGDAGHDGWQSQWMKDEDAVDRNARQYLPATPQAQRWQGWGTALKPAHEPIVLARKPLIGTVAQNVEAHGTGALNVDRCRIGTDAGWSYPNGRGGEGWHGRESLGQNLDEPMEAQAGRWPANVTLDPEAAAMLDEQSGETTAGNQPGGGGGGIWNPSSNGVPVAPSYGDTGGASRFFYTAKASRGERNAGLGSAFPVKRPDERDETAAGHFHEKGIQPQRNSHPTVKPIALMRWLCRLVTPPGGTILDPFTGSGTTGCAAVLEGFDFVGIEREAEYVEIAKARIAFWSQHKGREVADVLAEANRSEAERKAHTERGQMSLEATP